MVIAVNTRFLLGAVLEGTGYYVQEVFKRLSKTYPEHEFYFFFDRPYAEKFIFGKNVHPVVLGPAARHPLLWKYWFDIKVPLALRKIKADVFVSADGFCSLTTRVPQVLVLHDLGFLKNARWYKTTHAAFYKRYTGLFLKKAKIVATVSNFTRTDLVAKYGVAKEQVTILPNASRSIFQPLTFEEKMQVKEQYTSGKEFFICTGAIHPRKNIINLLKAFSLFKKRQKSSLKLVLAGRLAWKNEAFEELLNTYKYRSDVVLTGYVDENELARLTASAYALVYPSLFEGFGVPVLEAMQAAVPVLTTQQSAMQEVAQEAALYFDANNPASIAEQLMLIYKDEHLRSRLIEKGKERNACYNWDATANALWQCIEKAVAPEN